MGICAMVFGTTFFAYVINILVDLVTNLNPSNAPRRLSLQLFPAKKEKERKKRILSLSLSLSLSQGGEKHHLVVQVLSRSSLTELCAQENRPVRARDDAGERRKTSTRGHVRDFLSTLSVQSETFATILRRVKRNQNYTLEVRSIVQLTVIE